MIYSPILKSLPEPLRQPDRLALLASVGFHGLLFSGLALLPMASKSINTGRVVNLIELSPAERSRLPGLSTSQILSLPNPPSASKLPQIDLPPLSQIPDFSAPPPLKSFDFGSLPSSQLGPRQPIPSAPIYLPLPQGPTTVKPGNVRPVPLPAFPASPPEVNTNSQLPKLEPFKLPPPPEPVAEVPTQPSSSASPEPAASPAPSESASEGASEVMGKLGMWLISARKVYDPQLIPKREEADYKYPQQACKDQLEGYATLAALVSPTGKLVAPGANTELAPNPHFLSSTAQPILDNAAIAAVESYPFKVTGNYQALLFGFNFKYSEAACTGKATSDPAQDAQEPQTGIPAGQEKPGLEKSSQRLEGTKSKSINQSPKAPTPQSSQEAKPEAAPQNAEAPTSESSPQNSQEVESEPSSPSPIEPSTSPLPTDSSEPIAPSPES